MKPSPVGRKRGREVTMAKTHYAGCDRAHEGDNMDYWGAHTACGLEVDGHDDLPLSDRKDYVTCKNCLKRITTEQPKTISPMIVNTELARSRGHLLKDLWETPQNLFKILDEEFHFTLDPCCFPNTAKCEKYYTPSEDGLKQDWMPENVFVNPPYSRGNIDRWVKKCYMEHKKGCCVVALLPVSTSSSWWHDWVWGKAELRFIKRRIRFVGAPFTAPFSSVVAIWDNPINRRSLIDNHKSIIL